MPQAHRGHLLRPQGKSRQEADPGPEPAREELVRAVLAATEHTAPHTVQGQGDHGHRIVPDDAFDSRPEIVHLAIGGEFAFGKNADEFTLLQCFGDGGKGAFVYDR